MKILSVNDPAYPALLKEIYRPPTELYVSGTVLPVDQKAIAIVGTRSATPYGLKVAHQLAGQLAGHGITVVSGLADGIDTSAHLGALKAGGRTLAVVGHGLDFLYPARNRELAQRIRSAGALISQFPLGVGPLKQNFPQRNRVIAGLSMGVVVIEAPARSGALITAREALEEGREVFAVPGPISSLKNAGCHKLIQDGAKLVQSIEDILEELAPHFEVLPRVLETGQEPSLSYDLIQALPIGEVVAVETLVQQLQRTPQELLPQLTHLELQGVIRPAVGHGGFCRVA